MSVLLTHVMTSIVYWTRHHSGRNNKQQRTRIRSRSDDNICFFADHYGKTKVFDKIKKKRILAGTMIIFSARITPVLFERAYELLRFVREYCEIKE